MVQNDYILDVIVILLIAIILKSLLFKRKK